MAGVKLSSCYSLMELIQTSWTRYTIHNKLFHLWRVQFQVFSYHEQIFSFHSLSKNVDRCVHLWKICVYAMQVTINEMTSETNDCSKISFLHLTVCIWEQENKTPLDRTTENGCRISITLLEQSVMGLTGSNQKEYEQPSHPKHQLTPKLASTFCYCNLPFCIHNQTTV